MSDRADIPASYDADISREPQRPPAIGDEVTVRFRDLARNTLEITGTLTGTEGSYIAIEVGGARRVISKRQLRSVTLA